MLINLSLHFVIGARWNDNFTVSLFQFQDERLSVISLVGNHIIGRVIFDEQFSRRDVVAFAPVRMKRKALPKASVAK